MNETGRYTNVVSVCFGVSVFGIACVKIIFWECANFVLTESDFCGKMYIVCTAGSDRAMIRTENAGSNTSAAVTLGIIHKYPMTICAEQRKTEKSENIEKIA